MLNTSIEVPGAERYDFARSVARSVKKQIPDFAASFVIEAATELVRRPKLVNLLEGEHTVLSEILDSHTFLHDGLTVEYRNRIFCDYIVSQTKKPGALSLFVVNVGEMHRHGLTKTLSQALNAPPIHNPIGMQISGLQSTLKMFQQVEQRLEENNPIARAFRADISILEKKTQTIRKSEILDTRFLP